MSVCSLSEDSPALWYLDTFFGVSSTMEKFQEVEPEEAEQVYEGEEASETR